jgi:hypothetical protein
MSSQVYNMNIKLIGLIVIGVLNLFITSLGSIYSHITDTMKIQVWKSIRDNLEIKFAHYPEKPIIDTFTKLEFSITDLRTGNHVKDLLALVTVTNGERLFKFQNLSAPNGDLSVEYIFPDDGTHQVLFRIDKNESIHAGSFQVFVPHQLPPSLLDHTGNLIIGLGVVAIVGITTIILLRKN